MKDEIKEILDKIKSNNYPFGIATIDANKLLDYITNLQEEKDKYKNVIDKIKEKGIMYYDPEYSKIYGELCDIPGANNTRTPVIVVDDDILELLEEVE